MIYVRTAILNRNTRLVIKLTTATDFEDNTDDAMDQQNLLISTTVTILGFNTGISPQDGKRRI